ncbi:hypothetical protein AMAG_19044 [Allomyces macrogynus ATCC 38327]|uniref:Uncharacterized protein n=1 Tax=Allomyces macrogynus (strain ATCC 38327) TaxID=578462 RepID=A0A0L0SMK3_ALLM3|nr:hypothetical protein AMAG_19044 [Allomyces macrogynus ATCC 38327]|eukprot:KNE63717.1 hypothetical protein AMAG_19044 [Allomyces macrogynus ATCC 38327]
MDAPPSPSTSAAAIGSPTPSHAALSATGSPPISPRAMRPDLIERGRRKLEKYQRRSASSLSDHSPTPLAHRSTPCLPGSPPSGDTSAALAAGNMVDGLDLASPEGLSTFLDRIRGLRDACTAMAAERDQLSAQLAAMRTTVAHRESVIEAMRNEVADARSHVAAVERDLEAVQADVADRDARDMRLEETIGDMKRELAEVATARDALAAEVQVLESRLGTALDELAAATAAAGAKEEVEALRAELENERRHARHQRHEIESALHVARAEANGLAQDLAAVKSELGVTTAQVAAVEAERDQLQLALQTKADMHHVALSAAEERVAANEHARASPRNARRPWKRPWHRCGPSTRRRSQRCVTSTRRRSIGFATSTPLRWPPRKKPLPLNVPNCSNSSPTHSSRQKRRPSPSRSSTKRLSLTCRPTSTRRTRKSPTWSTKSSHATTSSWNCTPKRRMRSTWPTRSRSRATRN